MEFSNSFVVDVPLERVWSLLLDAEQVAPCVPGAQLTESIDPLHHRGTVKIKLGAVQMTYRGELEMEPVEGTRTIVLKARGSESRGGGGASGTFTTILVPTEDGGTQVDIHTRVDVTGRVAQFGRGIMQDVANRMIKDFAACLEQKVTASGAEEPAQAAGALQEPAQPAATVSTSTSTAEQLPVAPDSAAQVSPPQPAPAAPQPANELRVGKLILDITRNRIAQGLRTLARIVEAS